MKGLSLKLALLALPVTCATLLLSCAGQVAPGGGPVDTTPPTIVRSMPDSNAVRVEEGRVELEFSKYVDRRSVEESIFISPSAGSVEFGWSGKEVVVRFGDSLKPRTTYVVTVGTDVRDVRAGNRMADSYTLAFSSGDSIDHGIIRGRITDDEPHGVMIFAYRLDGRQADTLNPTHTKPDYIVQSGADGSFALVHLRWGTYRVMAVRDEYHNLLYDRQIDAYGVWRHDVVLDSAAREVPHVAMRLTREDTARPFLTSARNVAPRQVVARFSEPLDSTVFDRAHFVLEDTLTHKDIAITSVGWDYGKGTDAWLTLGGTLDSGMVCRVAVQGAVDRAGNPVDSASGAVFPVLAPHDTMPPALTCSVKDSAREVPVDKPLTFRLSEQVLPPAESSWITLRDSTGTPVVTMLHWRGVMDGTLQFAGELHPAAWYTLRVAMDSLRDFSGNGYHDSTMFLRFRTEDLRATGTIEGTVRSRTGVVRRVVVEAKPIEKSGPPPRRLRLTKPGPFTFDRLPEGRYTLNAFLDEDSTGTYRYGKVFPFRPSAEFGTYPDTLKVRARWGVQGVEIPLE